MPPKSVKQEIVNNIKDKESLVTWMLNNIPHNLLLQCLGQAPSVPAAGPSSSSPAAVVEEAQAAQAALPPAQQKAAAIEAVTLGIQDILSLKGNFPLKASPQRMQQIAQYCPMFSSVQDGGKGTLVGIVAGQEAKGLQPITRDRVRVQCEKEAKRIVAELKGKAPAQSFGAIRFNTKFLSGGKKASGFISKAAKKAVKLAKKPLKPRGFVNPQKAASYATIKAIKSGKSIIGSGLAGRVAYKKAQGYNRKLAGKIAKSSLSKMKRLTGSPTKSLRNLPRSWMAFGATSKEEFKVLRGLKRRAGGAIRGLKSGIKGVKRRDKKAVKKGRKVGGIKGKLIGGVGRTINAGMAVPMVGSSVTRGFLRPSRTRRSRYGQEEKIYMRRTLPSRVPKTRTKTSTKKTKTKKAPSKVPSKALRERAKKLGIRVTKTLRGKRVYKTKAELEAAIKKKKPTRSLPKRRRS